MTRQFEYEGELWGVALSGISHGIGSATPVRISSWGVEFCKAADPLGVRIRGSVHKENLNELTDEELSEELRRGLEKIQDE